MSSSCSSTFTSSSFFCLWLFFSFYFPFSPVFLFGFHKRGKGQVTSFRGPFVSPESGGDGMKVLYCSSRAAHHAREVGDGLGAAVAAAMVYTVVLCSLFPVLLSRVLTLTLFSLYNSFKEEKQEKKNKKRHTRTTRSGRRWGRWNSLARNGALCRSRKRRRESSLDGDGGGKTTLKKKRPSFLSTLAEIRVTISTTDAVSSVSVCGSVCICTRVCLVYREVFFLNFFHFFKQHTLVHTHIRTQNKPD